MARTTRVETQFGSASKILKHTMLVLVVFLAACSSITGNAPGPQAESLPTAVQLNLEEAEAIAATFLDSWQNSDYPAMYSLISFRSRESYPQEDFIALYEDIATEMTLDSISFAMMSSLRQGNTVAVSYDITFNTVFLGPITDPGRLMRLIVTDEGWRVAWSPADIFAEMAGGGTLTMSREMPTRANIYDRDGGVLVNQTGVAIPVYVVQENIPNDDWCDATLMRVMRLTYSDLQSIYSNYAPNWSTLVGEIDGDIYEIESEALINDCGATFDERATRRYVSGGLAPHVIGYVGYPSPEMLPELSMRGIPQDAIIGLTGIERSFDETLAGTPGGRLVITSPQGEELRDMGSVRPGASEPVYLTIDSQLQLATQQALNDAYNDANWRFVARGAAAVVMDVHTGEILALASYPSFDPNIFNPDRPRADSADRLTDFQNNERLPQINRVTQGAYPPGSTFKIVTMAAAADSNVNQLDFIYNCSGVWNGASSGDHTRYGWILETGGAHGAINMTQALTGSCDPYFWQLGANMDINNPNLLPNYAVKMGYGTPTGINGLVEFEGQVPSPDWIRANFGQTWDRSDAVNIAIGQGDLLSTPLQVNRLTAAIANGGDLLVPQLVLSAGLVGEEPSYEMEPTVERNIDIRPDVIDAIYEAMCEVTTDPTLGTAEYVFGYNSSLGESLVSVCGKTGTSQVGGETTPPHAWFTAFAPAEEPEIAITIIVENSREGSEVSAPIVRRILETYYGYYEPTYRPDWWPPSWWQGDYVPMGSPGA